MLNSKLSFTHLVLSMLAGSALTFISYTAVYKNGATAGKTAAHADTAASRAKAYSSLRLSGYKNISPLVNEEPEYESDKYTSLKKDIAGLIKNETQSGEVTSASVYLNDFSENAWMTINQDEKYNVGSLIKSCVLITYLRMEETNPNLLEKEMVFQISKGYMIPKAHYVKDTTLVPGKKYKLRDMLQFMMAYSDSRTTFYLQKNMNAEIFKKIFPDLEMSAINKEDQQYYATAKEYSTIMKALYNASYLNITSSEYATSLMAKSTFRDGIVKLLPEPLKVAHNFGEFANGKTNELHESSIIYLNNQPYQLIIMTRGTDWSKQAGIMSRISKLVYDKMSTTTGV